MAEITGTGACTLPEIEADGAGKRWKAIYPTVANLLVPSIRSGLSFANVQSAIADAVSGDQALVVTYSQEGAYRLLGEKVVTLVNTWISTEATDQAKTMVEGDSLDFDDLDDLI